MGSSNRIFPTLSYRLVPTCPPCRLWSLEAEGRAETRRKKGNVPFEGVTFGKIRAKGTPEGIHHHHHYYYWFRSISGPVRKPVSLLGCRHDPHREPTVFQCRKDRQGGKDCGDMGHLLLSVWAILGDPHPGAAALSISGPEEKLISLIITPPIAVSLVLGKSMARRKTRMGDTASCVVLFIYTPFSPLPYSTYHSCLKCAGSLAMQSTHLRRCTLDSAATNQQ